MVLTADEIRDAWAEAEEVGRQPDGMERLCAEAFANYDTVAQALSEIAADCAVALVHAGLIRPESMEPVATHMSTGLKFGLLIADRAALRRHRK